MTTLQELDEVLAKVVGKQFDNMLDATRVGLDCAIFLQAHAPEIRAALELQAKLDDGWVLVPRETLAECREIAMEWTLRGRVPECGPFGQIAQDLDAMLNAAPPAGKEEQDGT